MAQCNSKIFCGSINCILYLFMRGTCDIKLVNYSRFTKVEVFCFDLDKKLIFVTKVESNEKNNRKN